MNTPTTIGKPGRCPTTGSTKSFLHPLFVATVLSLLLLPAAVQSRELVVEDQACNIELEKLTSELEACKARFVTPFTDTGGISLQAAVDAFVAHGEDWNGGESYGKNINAWDVSEVTSFSYLFASKTTFNDYIGDWNVASGTDFTHMFRDATAFNRDIGSWDVSSGTAFNSMFRDATAFNKDIGDWNVSSGTTFGAMFYGASTFNQDISSWNMAKASNFRFMFRDATAFNKDIGGWDVSSGTTFRTMFTSASTFNQDMSSWIVSSTADTGFMFQLSAMPCVANSPQYPLECTGNCRTKECS